MSRPLHIEFKNAFYHVASRGINRQALFLDAEDSNVFIGILRKVVIKFNLRLFAFCLMTNHYHLYLSTPDANLSKAIKALNQSYAIYFLSKYKDKDGKVFKARYMRRLVEDDLYSKNLIAYVHNNPYKLVSKIENWKYSSYPSYLGLTKLFDFVDYDWVWSQFADKVEYFRDFHESQLQMKWDPKEHTRAKTFLASDAYIERVINQELDFALINDDEVLGVRELKRVFNEKMLLNEIENSNLGRRLELKMRIYFLREFGNVALNELATRFKKQSKNISKIHLNFKKEIADKPELGVLLVQILRKANCET
jgi:putative transposase